MSFVPNTTPTPNWLYNGEMKKMNETELKVILLITRKTLGYFDPTTTGRKTQDYISQSQFIEFTGCQSRAIAKAIQSCVEHGWIIAKDKAGELCDKAEKRARRKVWYQLGSVFIDKLSGSQRKPESGFQRKSEVASSGFLLDVNLVSKGNNTKETITKEKDIHARFSVFWDSYPRKASRKRAEQVFSKISPSAELFAKIMASVEEFKKSAQWLKDDGQFIPHPATWLNQERWNDEIVSENPINNYFK